MALDILGIVSAGPADDLDDAMRSAGFGDTFAGFFGPVAHPSSSRQCQLFLVRHGCGGNLPAVEIDRRGSHLWSVSVLFSRTPTGIVNGYHDAGQFLTLEHRVDSVGALLSIGNPAAQVGMGPALHFAQIRKAAGPAGVEATWDTDRKLGFMARARAMLPARSRIFLDVRAEFHFTGRVPIGPYAPDALLGGERATFPSTSASFNYWLIGVGPGLRF